MSDQDLRRCNHVTHHNECGECVRYLDSLSFEASRPTQGGAPVHCTVCLDSAAAGARAALSAERKRRERLQEALEMARMWIEQEDPVDVDARGRADVMASIDAALGEQPGNAPKAPSPLSFEPQVERFQRNNPPDPPPAPRTQEGEARACGCDSAVHEGRPCNGDGRPLHDCVWCGDLLCQLCYSFHACDKANAHRAPAAAQGVEALREVETLRKHLHAMVDLADYHVHEIEDIASETRDPADIARAKRVRALFNAADQALAPRAPPEGDAAPASVACLPRGKCTCGLVERFGPGAMHSLSHAPACPAYVPDAAPEGEEETRHE